MKSVINIGSVNHRCSFTYRDLPPIIPEKYQSGIIHPEEDVFMHDNMKKPPVSREVAPAGVYDIDKLRFQCRAIGVIPNRSNRQRCRRALDLLNHGSIAFDYSDQDFDFFWVNSRNSPNIVYRVCKNGHLECSCTEALKGDQCEHQMAVLFYIAKRE